MSGGEAEKPFSLKNGVQSSQPLDSRLRTMPLMPPLIVAFFDRRDLSRLAVPTSVAFVQLVSTRGRGEGRGEEWASPYHDIVPWWRDTTLCHHTTC